MKMKSQNLMNETKKPFMKKTNFMGLVAGASIIVILGILLYFAVIDIKIFSFLAGIAVIIAGTPFFVDLLAESQREADIEQMFLEFARDLVEGVKSGTPISKSIINIRDKDFGSLNPHVKKLANQIGIGIPVKDALDNFSKDIKSTIISRAIGLIREAEVSGGKIENILESVAFSISQIEKLKKERKAVIYNLTVQGYIIFLIFIVIMLVMQFKILPIVSALNLAGGGDLSDSNLGDLLPGSGVTQLNPSELAAPFLALLISQGFFAGLVIGKISEGSVKGGLKHSFILVAISWLISSGAKVFLG
ncbi:MAG: type II secretion system F family protein [archaeon]|nr:type II secretion system F family protein [archaeon]